MAEISGKKKKLFCLPYAGGTKVFFNHLEKALAEDVTCISFDYAGHGKRNKEDYYETPQDMVEDVSGLINELTEPDDCFGLFGYSIGSVVVYEMLAQNLLKKTPEHIFLAAHEAPDIEWKSKQYYKLSDMELVEVLRSNGGFEKVDETVLGNRMYRRIYFEPLRADYRLIGMYSMGKRVSLKVPTTIFWSETDMTYEEIHTWDSYITDKDEIFKFKGNHFFLNDNIEEISQVIKSRWNVKERL